MNVQFWYIALFTQKPVALRYVKDRTARLLRNFKKLQTENVKASSNDDEEVSDYHVICEELEEVIQEAARRNELRRDKKKVSQKDNKSRRKGKAKRSEAMKGLKEQPGSNEEIERAREGDAGGVQDGSVGEGSRDGGEREARDGGEQEALGHGGERASCSGKSKQKTTKENSVKTPQPPKQRMTPFEYLQQRSENEKVVKQEELRIRQRRSKIHRASKLLTCNLLSQIICSGTLRHLYRRYKSSL